MHACICRRLLISLLAILVTAGCNRSAKIPAAKLKPHLYNRVVALCIGINDYSSPKIKDLTYAESDALALAERLRTLYGYESVALLGKNATRAAITAKIREYASQLTEKDALILYFAVHGQVIELPSHGRAGFLVPQDADLDLDDRSNIDKWSAEALVMRDLVAWIRQMKAHHVLLIADACCSGFMTKRGAFEGRKDLHLLLSEPSRVVLAATTERQEAGEDPETGHGYFTGAFLEQLARDDAASVTDLFVEIRQRVSQHAKEMLPQMANVSDGDGEFVFIPLTVPEYDVQVALRGGIETALKGVYERTLLRVAQKTRIEDVVETFNALDYRFSTQPSEHEKVWHEKLERFQENAQIGDELAMVALHYCYAKGLGTDKDPDKAFRWALRAHDIGHAPGKHALAHCYADGLGVPKNKAASAALYRDSADFVLSKFCLHEESLERFISAFAQEKEITLPFESKPQQNILDDLQAAANGGVELARARLAYLACYGLSEWHDLRLMSYLKDVGDLPSVGKNLIVVAALGPDLQLMPSLNDVSGIPREGKNLLIVAAVNQVLHFRIFDRDGKVVVDTNEKKLTAQAEQIEKLKEKLDGLWPPKESTIADKGIVSSAVAAILGRTPVLHFRIFDRDGSMVVDTDEKKLPGQARQIEELRKVLQDEWPPHPFTKVLSVEIKKQIITAVTSIVGHTIKPLIKAKPNEALACLQAAALKGSPVAHHYLASIYWEGIPEVVKPDPQKLLFHAHAAAEAGFSRAQSLLAQAYLSAPGVPRNYSEARQWAELAESQGSSSATVSLFQIHFNGRGVPQDFKKAAEYAERGDAAGNPRAILFRGILYWEGAYYPKDLDKALPFFKRAALLGEADAWLMAGDYYRWKYFNDLSDHYHNDSYAAEAAYCYLKAYFMGKHEEASDALRQHPQIESFTYGAGIRVREDEENSSPLRP